MTAKIHVIPRSDYVTDSERPWMELLQEVGIVGTRDRLVEAGLPAPHAASIAVWLQDQLDKRRGLSSSTIAGYRRTLDKLGRSIPG
jgi:hypothetical protein